MNAIPKMNPIPAASGGSRNPPAVDLSLSRCLDVRLVADHRVLGFGVDPVIETFERYLGLGAVLMPIRWVKLEDGPLTVVAVPEDVRNDPALPTARLSLKNLAAGASRKILFVSERAIRKQPALENAVYISRCARAASIAGDRVRTLTFLVERGGSAPLASCARYMRSAPDPVGAVLSLIARKAVWIDLSEPLGPSTPVHIRPRSLN